MKSRLFIAGAAALALTVAPAAAQTIAIANVGDNALCHFTDLQKAIDVISATAADRRLIRLQEGVRSENVSLLLETEQIEIGQRRPRERPGRERGRFADPRAGRRGARRLPRRRLRSR